MSKVTIKAPKSICLYQPHRAINTINFIEKIYRFLNNGNKLLLDFSQTREITAAASTVLFAHINRAQLFYQEPDLFEFRCLGSPSRIYHYLNEIYFTALRADSEEKLQELESMGAIFQSGTKAHLKIDNLQIFFQHLRNLHSSDLNKLNSLSLIETAIKEALLNVEHHAYLGTNLAIEHRWWQLLSYSKPDNVVNFVVYDLGIGIVDSFKEYNENGNPITLTNSKDVLLETLKPGITRWNSIDRGNGLPEVVKPTEDENVGLWISSNGLIYCNAKKYGINHECGESGFFLPGTLVEWNLSLE